MSGPTLPVALGIAYSQLTYHPPPVTSSFEGQTVVVTGGNNGLGKEAIRQLLQLNASRVIMGVRSMEKGATAKAQLEQTGKRVEVWQVDMASYASVIAFANQLKTLDRLDAVLLNAGSWPTTKAMAEGHEMTMTVNVISTVLLAQLLLPKLRETPKSRISIVGSNLHKFASLKARRQEHIFAALDAEPLQTSSEYDVRYHDAKMVLQICIMALAKEHQKQYGDKVCVTIMNPGYCLSDLNPPKNLQYRIRQKLLQRTTEEGGRSLVDAIALDKAAGRNTCYIDDCQISKESPWLATEDGEKTAERVWQEMQEILAGITPAV